MAELTIFEKHYQFLSLEESIGAMSSPAAGEFEQVFKSHFRQLHVYAMSFVKDHDTAEEIVQNVFFKLWSRSGGVISSGSLIPYLYTAVHNESLNFLKHSKIRQKHQASVISIDRNQIQQPGDPAHEKELIQKIQQALSALPEQCRTVFQMSRYEEMKYREIADELSISVKTVENHMGKALRILREKLADYLPLTMIFLNI